MAGDAFKDDVNDTNVIIEEFDDVCMCVGLYDGNQQCV